MRALLAFFFFSFSKADVLIFLSLYQRIVGINLKHVTLLPFSSQIEPVCHMYPGIVNRTPMELNFNRTQSKSNSIH